MRIGGDESTQTMLEVKSAQASGRRLNVNLHWVRICLPAAKSGKLIFPIV